MNTQSPLSTVICMLSLVMRMKHLCLIRKHVKKHPKLLASTIQHKLANKMNRKKNERKEKRHEMKKEVSNVVELSSGTSSKEDEPDVFVPYCIESYPKLMSQQ